jgi:hypothetical protein
MLYSGDALSASCGSFALHMEDSMNVKQAQEIVKQHDCRLTCVDGEYRVADTFNAMQAMFPDESRSEIIQRLELRAYYTTDLADAVATARFFRESLNPSMPKEI